jgi:hypothetical protein
VTTATLASRDLVFSSERHEYILPDGQLVPSVTQILRACGVSVDFEELAARSPAMREAITIKRALGHALHQDSHAYDDDDALDWSTVDPRVRPYLEAWCAFRTNTGLTPTVRERLVYHEILGYAGTLDGIFSKPDGSLVLCDLKTGDLHDSACAYQTAGYVLAWEHEHGAGPMERWGVQLVPGRRVPYRIEPFGDWRDFGAFKAFVATYYCQHERRPRR